MAWTAKWYTSNQILHGDAINYGSNIVWLDSTYKIIEFDGTAETTLLDAPTDIPDFYSGGYPVVAVLDGTLIFVCLTLDASSYYHAKVYTYDGAGSWTNTLTLNAGDTTTHDINVVLHKNIRLALDFYSTYTTGTTFEHRSTTDGAAWRTDSGITSPADASVSAQRVAGNESKFIKYVYNRASSTHEIWEYDSTTGTWSFLYDLSGAGISYNVSPVFPAGDSVPAMFALRDADNVIMASEDGATWTATALTESSGTAPDVFAAGYREFVANGGNLYYWTDAGAWQLIETVPAAYVFAAVNFGGKLWVHADSSGTGAGAWYEHDTFSDWGLYSPPFAPSPPSRLLDLAAPLLGGDYIWGSLLDNGSLVVVKYDIDAMLAVQTTTIGSATDAEIDNGTYIQNITALDDNNVILFGYVPHDSLGVSHVLVSSDGGATFSQAVGSQWGSDKCAGGKFDAAGTFYAIRTSTSSQPKLYKLDSVMRYVSTLPLPAGTNIKDKGVILGIDGRLYVAGVTSGGTVKVVMSNAQKTGWSDITGNLSLSGINGLALME